MGLAQLHVVREPMVYGVRPLPRVVRYEENRMENKTNRVLDSQVFGECAVATLVREDP